MYPAMTPWECIHSAFIGWIIYRCQLSLIDWLWHSVQVHLYWFSSTYSLLDLSATKRQIHLQQESGFTCFSLQFYQYILHMLGHSFVVCAHIWDCYAFLKNWSFYHSVIFLFILNLYCYWAWSMQLIWLKVSQSKMFLLIVSIHLFLFGVSHLRRTTCYYFDKVSLCRSDRPLSLFSSCLHFLIDGIPCMYHTQYWVYFWWGWVEYPELNLEPLVS